MAAVIKTWRDLPPDILESFERCYQDFTYFAERCLFIRTKSGEVVPFRLNRAQRFIHEKLEAQLAKTGKVRAIIVKGRQLGASTYIQARFYWRLWRSKHALRAYILTHEDPATANLFGMAQLFQERIPKDAMPATLTANAKELIFADSKCGYQVATAGNKAGGRSATIQLFHGSEVAYWPNAEEHTGGVFQTVGNIPGTEVILESTANGIGNVFHRYASAAIRGESELQPIFVPWFWGEDYETPCRWAEDESPGREWETYGYEHQLSWDQLQWAYDKNKELATALSAPLDKPCWKFSQEYPGDFDEAFQTSGNSFIPGALVLKARRPTETVIGTGPVILGVDPARLRDKVGVIDRCGRRMGERICQRIDPGGSTDYVTQQIASIIERLQPDIVNIDTSEGTGAAVFETLSQDWGDKVRAVSFGSRPVGYGPTGDRLYANRRAEMWDSLREWFSTEEQPVQVPDDDALHADLTSATWGPQATRYAAGNNELVLESKDKIKERLGYSPDLGDAAALTFATAIAPANQSGQIRQRQRKPRGRTGY